MTTVAKHTIAANEEGQSVFEFLLMLPVMIGLVVIMAEVNTAIQVSIVDQQYARAEATFLTFNSPIYPERDAIRIPNLDQKGYNQMLIGVMDNIIFPIPTALPIRSHPPSSSLAAAISRQAEATIRAWSRPFGPPFA